MDIGFTTYMYGYRVHNLYMDMESISVETA